MNERRLRILVTGGAGYLGSTLVPLLLGAGHTVRVLDSLRYGGRSLLGVWSHPAFDFARGDVRDAALVRRAVDGMDAVVHLAAIVGDPACSREPDEARAVNLDASRQLLALSAAADVERFIFASTCSNYGRMSDPEALLDETSALRPLSLYAETKVAFEQTLLAVAGLGATVTSTSTSSAKATATATAMATRNANANANARASVAGAGGRARALCPVVLRFATIFGVSPRMRFDLTVNEFTRDMLTRGHLVVFGEQFWRPYVHVRDAASAIRLALTSPAALVRGQVFNVGDSQQNFQKQQIVDLIRRQAPDATVEYVHVDDDPRDYRVSFAKIHDQLAFHTTMSVENGVAEIARLVQQGVLPDAADASYRN
jgi:nucleoside-diphosphate-sugar epimerase